MDSSQAGFDEYEDFVWRMNPPRVTVDNFSSNSATLLKVDSPNRHSILLEMVQILTDLDLRIHKAYISSDGSWFMDVFHVTDAWGKKVSDEETVLLIEKRICASHELLRRRVGILPNEVEAEHTTIELTGTDRPGLMSEISALLLHLRCNVVGAELWTHKRRVACLLYVTDEETGGPIQAQPKLQRIKESLSNVLRGDCKDSRGVKTNFSTHVTHTDRRLHQMMFADRDYEHSEEGEWSSSSSSSSSLSSLEDRDLNAKIIVEDCDEKGYSVVHIECRNRPKLFFDTVCTLTDMQYVVFHATIDTNHEMAFQEYYIRHIDGSTLDSEAERRRVVQCLRAALQRRVSEGLRLELCTGDRVGLLSDVTRIFREHGLSVSRADVATNDNKAVNIFYVTDMAGHQVGMEVIEAVRRQIGNTVLKAKEEPLYLASEPQPRVKFSLGNWFGMPSQFLYSLGLIRS